MNSVASSSQETQAAATGPGSPDVCQGAARPFSSKLRVLDLFSGIGGFSLGLERTGGFETVAFCEIDPFCRRVLAKHWPNVRQYEDVRTLTADALQRDGIAVDVICGGFPCQDISFAGKGAGIEGERSGLWSEYARIISELRPSFVIVENVAALLGRGLDRILGDLASLGFDAEWDCIPASYIGAPHRRDRLWLVAYEPEITDCSSSNGRNNCKDNGSPRQSRGGGVRALGDANGSRLEGLRRLLPSGREWTAWADGEVVIGQDGKKRFCPPGIPLVANGLPYQVERIGSTGNAVVPQIPEIIGRAILASREAA